MELAKLEPMSVGQIIGKSFRLYLKNFWWFLAMLIVVYLPFTAVQLVFSLYKPSETTRNFRDWQSSLFEIPSTFVLRILATFVSFWLSITIFRKLSAHYLHDQISFWETYKVIWAKFRTVLMASVLFAVLFLPSILWPLVKELGVEPSRLLGAVVAGALLAACVIMLLAAIWFIVTPQCIATTQLSAWQSMKQSKTLVKGNMWRILGLWVLFIVISMGIFWVTKYLVVGPVLRSVTENSMMVRQLRFRFVGFICAPLFSLAGSLLYYDLRARQDRSETETIARFEKPRTSRLAIASVVLGLLGMLIGVCLSAAIPGLILGVAALIAIQSRKGQLIGQLKGRGLALAGIGISCLAIYLSYIQVLPFFFPPLEIRPCEAGEVLRGTQLANLPISATSVQAEERIRGDSGKQYLVFQATADDIERFVAESESLKNHEPVVFDSDNMYLPRKHRSDFIYKKDWQEYSRHKHFRRRRYWPDWYDPTIRLKGRKYDITTSEDNHRRGTVVINDEIDTVYILVRW